MKKKDHSVSRRKFLTSAILGSTGLVAGVNSASAKPHQPRNKKHKKVVYRTLGKTGIRVPVVGMGKLPVDNPRLVKAALDNGIVFIDTALMYYSGRHEKMISKVLKDYPRDYYVIATKIKPPGYSYKTGLYSKKATEESFLKKFDVSMKNLGLDHVDILYHHDVVTREAALYEPVLNAMRKIKESGRAKHLGVSTHKNEPEMIRAAIESGVYEIILTSYNFKQDHIADLNKAIKEAAAAGLGIVGMKNLAGGFLDKEKKKPVNAKAALRWALQNPDISAVVPGFTNFEQLEECVEVLHNLKMNKKEKDDLLLASKETGMYCNACSKCVAECKKELPVPELMRAYMYTYGYRRIEQAQDLLLSLNVEQSPCIDCDECTVECVKDFDVAQKISDVTRLVDVPRDFIV
jgi:predicted aldo/keto reductase-like oxidoreductase